MDAKFFDYRRYDLTKAGRYKVHKKLSVLDRMEGLSLEKDLVSAEGKTLVKKGVVIDKELRNELRAEIDKGINCPCVPFTHTFSHPIYSSDGYILEE